MDATFVTPAFGAAPPSASAPTPAGWTHATPAEAFAHHASHCVTPAGVARRAAHATPNGAAPMMITPAARRGFLLPGAAAAKAAAAFEPRRLGVAVDPHARWHTPLDRAAAAAPPPSDGKISHRPIPRHHGNAPRAKGPRRRQRRERGGAHSDAASVDADLAHRDASSAGPEVLRRAKTLFDDFVRFRDDAGTRDDASSGDSDASMEEEDGGGARTTRPGIRRRSSPSPRADDSVDSEDGWFEGGAFRLEPGAPMEKDGLASPGSAARRISPDTVLLFRDSSGGGSRREEEGRAGDVSTLVEGGIRRATASPTKNLRWTTLGTIAASRDERRARRSGTRSQRGSSKSARHSVAMSSPGKRARSRSPARRFDRRSSLAPRVHPRGACSEGSLSEDEGRERAGATGRPPSREPVGKPSSRTASRVERILGRGGGDMAERAETEGGLPASRLEDRFAVLGLGLRGGGGE